MNKFLPLFLILVIISCQKDEPTVEHEKSVISKSELKGNWFRTEPIRFAAVRGNPAFERGEKHIEIKFQDDGIFEHSYTSFGFYENQNPNDSTSITIYSGTYEIDDELLTIVSSKRTYIQIFDGDKIERDTSVTGSFAQHNYQWPAVNLQMTSDSLRFIYHDITDIVHPDQISPGIELKEEIYGRR